LTLKRGDVARGAAGGVDEDHLIVTLEHKTHVSR
jgi:hypothetical protein